MENTMFTIRVFSRAMPTTCISDVMAEEGPAYLTIVARDDHGGYMMHSSNEMKGVYIRSELLHRIAVGTLGMAAKDAALALTVQKKINEILRDELEEAIRILSDHKEEFDRLVDALMEKTHMHKEEIQAILM